MYEHVPFVPEDTGILRLMEANASSHISLLFTTTRRRNNTLSNNGVTVKPSWTKTELNVEEFGKATIDYKHIGVM